MRKSVRVAIAAAVCCFVLSGKTSAYNPDGWVWFNWPYTYPMNQNGWFYMNQNETMNCYNYQAAQWVALGQGGTGQGWMYFSWPYGFSLTQGQWYYMNQGDTLNCFEYATQEWSQFGQQRTGLWRISRWENRTAGGTITGVTTMHYDASGKLVAEQEDEDPYDGVPEFIQHYIYQGDNLAAHMEDEGIDGSIDAVTYITSDAAGYAVLFQEDWGNDGSVDESWTAHYENGRRVREESSDETEYYFYTNGMLMGHRAVDIGGTTTEVSNVEYRNGKMWRWNFDEGADGSIDGYGQVYWEQVPAGTPVPETRRYIDGPVYHQY